MSIVPKATLSLNERKFTIFSQLNKTLPYTITALKQMLEALCGADGYSLEVKSEIYTLFVRVALVAKSNYDNVHSLLHKIVPANMVIDLSLMYTQNSMLSKYKHTELSAYTHNQIRNELVENG